MNRDDIEYTLEIIEDAISNKDWDLLEEARQYLQDCLSGNNSQYEDDD